MFNVFLLSSLYYLRIMLHGKGDQYWMTKRYEQKRLKALEWRFRFSDEQLEDYDVEEPLGDGRYYYRVWRRKQMPFPYRNKKYVDIRKVDPRIGD